VVVVARVSLSLFSPPFCITQTSLLARKEYLKLQRYSFFFNMYASYIWISGGVAGIIYNGWHVRVLALTQRLQ